MASEVEETGGKLELMRGLSRDSPGSGSSLTGHGAPVGAVNDSCLERRQNETPPRKSEIERGSHV